MLCRKCKKAIPDGSHFCNLCGAKQTLAEAKRRPKQRGNGQGTVYKRGNSWACLRRELVGEKYISAYKGGFGTKKEALEYLSQMDGPTITQTSKKISFRALYEKWIERHSSRVSSSTIACYKAAYKYFVPLYEYPFAALTTEQLQQCVDACPHGRRTRENMKALCTSLYKYAHETGVTSEDYGQHIYIAPQSSDSGRMPKQAFTHEELERLFKAHSDGVEGVDVVLILCYTGFRINELLKLRKGDVNLKQGYIVGGGKTKAGTNRIVTISPKIMPMIRARCEAVRDDDGLLFVEAFKKGAENAWREKQREILSGIEGVRPLLPHECRHTFATLMKAVDGNKTDKMRLIGHADERMLLHYTHSDIDALKAITDLI